MPDDPELPEPVVVIAARTSDPSVPGSMMQANKAAEAYHSISHSNEHAWNPGCDVEPLCKPTTGVCEVCSSTIHLSPSTQGRIAREREKPDFKIAYLCYECYISLDLFKQIESGLATAELADEPEVIQAELDALTEAQRELKLFQIAQRITDEVFGVGAYVRVNHFDPSKGETHA